MKRILTAIACMILSLSLHAGEVKKLTPEYEKFLNTRPRPNITIEAKKKLNAYYKELDNARKELSTRGEFGGDYAYIVSAADLTPSYNYRSKNVENFTRGRYYFVNSNYAMNLYDEDSEHPLLLVSEEDVVEIEDNRHLVFTLKNEKSSAKSTFRSSVFRKTEQYDKELKARKKGKRKKSSR